MTHPLARRLSNTAPPSLLFTATTSISNNILASLKASFSTESSGEADGKPREPHRDSVRAAEDGAAPSKSSRTLEDDGIFDFTSGFDDGSDRGTGSRKAPKSFQRGNHRASQSATQPVDFPDLLSPEAAIPSPDKLTSRVMDGCFLISNKVYELWKKVWNKSEAEILQSANSKKETPPNVEDYLVLAEVIEMYLSVVRSTGHHRSSNPRDTQALENLAAAIHMQYGSLLDQAAHGNEEAAKLREAIGSPLERRVVNMAPPGRLPWEVLGVDESRGVIHWGVDLTSGRVPDPWRNARLSEAAKQTMANLHAKDPDRYSVQALAKVYRIREQRVMAILALKELEMKAFMAGDQHGDQEPEESRAKASQAEADAERLRQLMDEGFWNCSAARGSGERHVVTVPSYPSYKSVPVSTLKSLKDKNLLDETPLGDGNQQEVATQETVRRLIGMKSDEEMAIEWAEREERRLVEEFKTNLDFNMGRIGASLHKGSKRSSVPRRPEKGKRFGLLVTPINGASGPYVAEAPDGSVCRDLNDDERLLLSRRRRLSRRS